MFIQQSCGARTKAELNFPLSIRVRGKCGWFNSVNVTWRFCFHFVLHANIFRPIFIIFNYLFYYPKHVGHIRKLFFNNVMYVSSPPASCHNIICTHFHTRLSRKSDAGLIWYDPSQEWRSAIPAISVVAPADGQLAATDMSARDTTTTKTVGQMNIKVTLPERRWAVSHTSQTRIVMFGLRVVRSRTHTNWSNVSDEDKCRIKWNVK